MCETMVRLEWREASRSRDSSELLSCSVAAMLLVLTEEHKEHLSFLTRVDVTGERWRREERLQGCC